MYKIIYVQDTEILHILSDLKKNSIITVSLNYLRTIRYSEGDARSSTEVY